MNEPNFLSLEWFKSKLNFKKTNISQDDKLFEYNNIKLVNNTLTIVLKDGEILTINDVNTKEYSKIISFKTDKQFKEFLNKNFKEEVNIKSVKNVDFIKSLEIIKTLPDFRVENDIVYLSETNRSLPQLLVEKFIEIIDKESKTQYNPLYNLQDILNKNIEYLAHKRFFLWCCLNPKSEVMNSLYTFIHNNSFNITKEGFVVALRNVVTVSSDTKLVDAITNNYQKIKVVWKKNTTQYYLNKDFNLTKKAELAFDKRNLKELYQDLPELSENRYTDDYTKTFDIRVGRVVNMPEEECNYTTAECNNQGLHFTADQINYVGCGDQCMLILINPRKIVGIGEHKGRCYEYFPIMTVNRLEATTILKEKLFDTLLLDEKYAKDELNNLLLNTKKSFVLESMKHTFNVPPINSEELNSIVKSLSTIKNEIKDRVVTNIKK